MHRLLGILICITWLVALSALLARDVVPYWRSQEPPVGRMSHGRFQLGIFDAQHRRIGTGRLWMSEHADLFQVESTTELTALSPLSHGPALPPIEIDSTFSCAQIDGRLLAFNVQLRRDDGPLGEIAGQRIGEDFACSIRFGRIQHAFGLDARVASGLAESLRPFNHLADLHVGQTWRLRTIDVVALLRDRTVSLSPRLARVTARESIDHRGRAIPCFRIETDDATAWADDAGRVLLQRVHLPLLGQLEFRDEPCDEARRPHSPSLGRVPAQSKAVR